MTSKECDKLEQYKASLISLLEKQIKLSEPDLDPWDRGFRFGLRFIIKHIKVKENANT